jgi:hypothetical protein
MLCLDRNNKSKSVILSLDNITDCRSDISNTLWVMLHSGEILVWKITKGNNSKIMQSRVIILVHCTPPQWGLSTYEGSSSYLKHFLRYVLDKNVGRKDGWMDGWMDGRTEGRKVGRRLFLYPTPPFRRWIIKGVFSVIYLPNWLMCKYVDMIL